MPLTSQVEPDQHAGTNAPSWSCARSWTVVIPAGHREHRSSRHALYTDSLSQPGCRKRNVDLVGPRRVMAPPVAFRGPASLWPQTGEVWGFATSAPGSVVGFEGRDGSGSPRNEELAQEVASVRRELVALRRRLEALERLTEDWAASVGLRRDRDAPRAEQDRP
jgi:hypothetical protein